MQIKSASRSFLLFFFLLTLATFTLFGFLATFGLTLESGSVAVSSLFALGALWLLSAVWKIWRAYTRSPYFRIDVSPGQLAVGGWRDELFVRSSEVSEYYVYTNYKVTLRVATLHDSMNFWPHAKVKGGYITFYVFFLKGGARDLMQALQEFDASFQEKKKISWGMLFQHVQG